ncbi:MAG TPA: thioredoxin family protein [Luteibacter sp.]|jgi:thiol-disulfide isomerase/thioredoxin|nr:thioredoxin family protein [Luteibacter sp.]
MKARRILLATLYASVISAPITFAQDSNAMLPSFAGATTWLNTSPLTAESVRGKVVLVDFWTYTCINSLRPLPYVRAWAAKYKDQGLVVIGVQAPEFAFEKKLDNVRWAVKSMRLDYPIAVDNDHAVWDAFRNEYWPALYIVDAKGRIRHHQFGEGEYEQSERVIQQLLVEAGATGVDRSLVQVDGHGTEAAPDWNDLKSAENYLGYARTEGFVSPEGAVANKPHVYSAPARIPLNHWALSGDWTMTEPAIVLNKAGGRIVYRFHARDLHLVMGPATMGKPVRFRVLIDGKAPGDAHGADIDAEGNGRVSEQRLYQLIRQPVPIVDRQFEIEFLDPGVEGYVFTFG